jgi:hypothetical protein
MITFLKNIISFIFLFLLNLQYFLLTSSEVNVLNKQKQQETWNRTKSTRVFYSSSKKIFSLTGTLVIFFLTIFIFPQSASAFGPYANPAPVDIGTASDFIVIGKTAVTSDNVSTFGGNIGVSPTAAAALTGVVCANMTEGRMHTITAPAGPTGCITTAGTQSADITKLSTATTDFDAAYTDARNQTTHPFDITTGAVDMAAWGVKGRGIYQYTGAPSMATGLILRGSSTDIWIFQINWAKTQAANALMVLQNEAGVVDWPNWPQAKNIFWAIDGAASQGANTNFIGVLMTSGAIGMAGWSTFNGRAFATTTVTPVTTTIYIAADVADQATVTLAPQTVTYTPSWDNFTTLVAGGWSGSGALTYNVTSAGAWCSVGLTTGVLTYTSAGNCGITATKAADDNFAEASSTQTTFTIDKASQSALTLTNTTGTFPTGFTVGTSGGDWTGAVTFVAVDGTATGCTINSTTWALTFTSAGTCTVTSTKASDTNYNVISSSATTVTIDKASQSALTLTNTTGTFPTGFTVGTSGGDW